MDCKEVGGYRTAECGALRRQQFSKVELFQFNHPNAADAVDVEPLGKDEEPDASWSAQGAYGGTQQVGQVSRGSHVKGKGTQCQDG